MRTRRPVGAHTTVRHRTLGLGTALLAALTVAVPAVAVPAVGAWASADAPGRLRADLTAQAAAGAQPIHDLGTTQGLEILPLVEASAVRWSCRPP